MDPVHTHTATDWRQHTLWPPTTQNHSNWGNHEIELGEVYLIIILGADCWEWSSATDHRMHLLFHVLPAAAQTKSDTCWKLRDRPAHVHRSQATARGGYGSRATLYFMLRRWASACSLSAAGLAPLCQKQKWLSQHAISWHLQSPQLPGT